ncbi:MAG: hypothetical protein MUC96_21630 [Myxococcaceae bacterium]|jgi:hypothetical protein|nr:hypothetical protein [Myxococcaceae bacterium]
MVLVLVSLVVSAAPPAWNALGLPPSLRRVLDVGDFGATPGGFRAITLSHLADGCASRGVSEPALVEPARACVTAALHQALALHPHHCPRLGSGFVCDVDALAAEADPLGLSHLLLVLGAADRLGPCPDEALHRALAEALAQQSKDDPWHVPPSYRKLPLRWPADQSALLAGLARADAAHGTTFHVEPLAGFLATLDAQGTHRSGLPVSELTGRGPGARFPRGCAQSFISRYLAEVEPTRTLGWWERYKAGFFVELPFGVIGFREWPRGVDRQGDVDSGPIVLGIGTAASALAISAAKANGDGVLAKRLEASAEAVMSLGVGSDVVHAPFAEAIRYEARWRPVAPEASSTR